MYDLQRVHFRFARGREATRRHKIPKKEDKERTEKAHIHENKKEKVAWGRYVSRQRYGERA